MEIFVDSGDDEKVALAVLCKILPKKSIENGIKYVYEECMVSL